MGIEANSDSAFARAVRAVGSQSAFARLVGRSQPWVYAALKDGTPLPAENVLVVERETGISRHDLRPDVYGPASAAEPEAADKLEAAR